MMQAVLGVATSERLFAGLAIAVDGRSCAAGLAPRVADPFYMGADISLDTFMQQQNVVVHRQRRRQADAIDILYDRGANFFRLRMFVNPQTTYTNGNFGAIQTTSLRHRAGPANQGQRTGAKLLLDFHYSDTWADPGKQIEARRLDQPDTTPICKSTVQTYTQRHARGIQERRA